MQFESICTWWPSTLKHRKWYSATVLAPVAIVYSGWKWSHVQEVWVSRGGHELPPRQPVEVVELLGPSPYVPNKSIQIVLVRYAATPSQACSCHVESRWIKHMIPESLHQRAANSRTCFLYSPVIICDHGRYLARICLMHWGRTRMSDHSGIDHTHVLWLGEWFSVFEASGGTHDPTVASWTCASRILEFIRVYITHGRRMPACGRFKNVENENREKTQSLIWI